VRAPPPVIDPSIKHLGAHCNLAPENRIMDNCSTKLMCALCPASEDKSVVTEIRGQIPTDFETESTPLAKSWWKNPGNRKNRKKAGKGTEGEKGKESGARFRERNAEGE